MKAGVSFSRVELGKKCRTEEVGLVVEAEAAWRWSQIGAWNYCEDHRGFLACPRCMTRRCRTDLGKSATLVTLRVVFPSIGEVGARSLRALAPNSAG
ncbi:hypothetical protein R1sor_009291 [Riccia sorocarpa]|uniref:Uncharacterized protein n=1 Tax=Riccia sorocarpa TaxID=122646 RepID=A0ABD3HY77_9MARC